MGERGAGNAALGVEGFPMSDLLEGRSAQLDRVLADLLRQAPEVEAASVVSFDGLPMASALPAVMDENRVAAMSAALLSLGERAAEGLGRGELSQVYVEGESGTVFLISADDEAVLVAVGARGAKVGLLLYEIRRAAAEVGAALRGLYSAPAPAVEVEYVEEYVGSAVDVHPVEVVDEPSAPIEAVAPVEDVRAVDLESLVEPEVDENDPLGLGALDEMDAELEQAERDTLGVEEPEPAVSAPVDGAEGADEADGTDRDSDDWPQPTPDLGAWATFTPGSSAGSNESSWS